MAHYKWNASDYASHSSAQLQWAQELISKLNLQGDEALLDIGCGDGKISALIARSLTHGSVVGIDSSQDMIDLANMHYPHSEFPNLTFRTIDVRDMTFNDQFNIIFSNAVLHWVIDHLSFLPRIKQSLKKSGKFLFQMGGKDNAKDILKVFDILVKKGKWRSYFSDFTFPYGFYSVEEYKVFLSQTGLKALRVELIPKDMKQKGIEGLAGWIRTTWLPYTHRIPAHLREEFISELIEEYLKLHPMDEDGYIHVEMMRLEVEGEKL